ncbi:MAG: hypothetical protein U9R60_04905 [Bacteroidota bacterium]|nr:hypothetical protein [Bacteroidota bacterium]
MKHKVYIPEGLFQWIDDAKCGCDDRNSEWCQEKNRLLEKLKSVYDQNETITDEEEEHSCQKIYEQNLRLKTWIRAVSGSSSSFLVDHIKEIESQLEK